jgi:hypothetical protein
LTPDEIRKRTVTIFLVMWFAVTWGLFSYMKTKFHHYIFPSVPAIALLTGIMLDGAYGDRSALKGAQKWVWLAMSAIGVALAVFGFSRLLPGHFFGEFSADMERATPNGLTVPTGRFLIGVLAAFAGLVIATRAEAMVRWWTRQKWDESREEGTEFWAVIAAAAAVGTLLVTHDLASRPSADIKGQERLIQMFTYRYDRVWPTQLSFSPALLGFGLSASMVTFFAAFRSVRRQAIVSLMILAGLFVIWDLDVYMVKLAPHWGQRPLFEAYYSSRSVHKENNRWIYDPVVAFEMNWKGENFYSGGRLLEFGNGFGGDTANERSRDRLKTWLGEIKTHVNAVYFVSERGKQNAIEEMVRTAWGTAPKERNNAWVKALTDDKMTNKFVMFEARWRKDNGDSIR